MEIRRDPWLKTPHGLNSKILHLTMECVVLNPLVLKFLYKTFDSGEMSKRMDDV
jgi:hypothetical protein